MVLPILNGGRVEKMWQPTSAVICVLPISFSAILIALNTGRSGQPTQNPGGRTGTGLPSPLAASRFALLISSDMAVQGVLRPSGHSAARNFDDAVEHQLAGIFAGRRQHVLAVHGKPDAHAPAAPT